MVRDYQPIRRHSSRSSQAAEGVSPEDHLAAEASGTHLASDDYPEMGDVLRDRPDPGQVITVVGALRGPVTAAATYGRPDDARDEEYNGGPQDTGTYWAEPGQQEWKEEHLGPQEAVPPPPWAPAVMEAEMPPALARLAQIEEARHLFGAPVPWAAPGTAPLRRRATTINGTQIDDHGDAPGHGTVPRASAPGSYDARSTEGNGDPKWSDPVDKKDTEDFNGATVGMYPEGMSAGGGPSLPVGAFTAHYYQQPGQHELERHLTGEHGVSPADLSALRMRAWNSYPEELSAAHVRVSQGRPLDDWYGERVTGHGRPMSHTDIQDHLYRQHGVMMAGGHSPGELEAAHQAEHANLDFPPGEHHGPAERPETEAPDEYGPDESDAATWMAHQGPIDPVFGSRVPWTGKERGTLHRWQDVPTGTWGDFVPSDEFPGSGARQSPAAQAEREEERARELSAEAADHALGHLAALGPDPAGEAAARDHLLSHHGWDEGNVSRVEARGDRLTHMHEALHDAGLASHVHRDPAEESRQRELSERFGNPYQADPRRGHPGQGGTRLDDPADAIAHAAPRDWEGMHANMPLRAWSMRATGAIDPPHPHDDESSSLDSGPSEGDEGFPGLHDDLQSPDDWPLAQAGAPSGPAYTQGSQDGHGGRVFPPPPPPSMPAAAGEEPPGGEDEDGGEGKKIKIEVKAHLGAFTAAVADPRFRFEFTAAWSDVVAKAKRIRREGHVRITHASAGLVIGEVRGDHDTYESGLQRPPGKPQTIQHWACGCPWASFHQDKSLGTRYAGRPCSHVMALQYEAQARGMFGKAVARDEQSPAWSRGDVTVKSWPPYEGEPHAGRWADTWLAPSASLRRAAQLRSFDQLQPHEQSSVAQYHQQMIEEGNAAAGSTPRDYAYDSRQEPKDDFLGRYMDADDEFKREYGPGDWEAHHQDTIARHPIPGYPEADRWPLIVSDGNPNYVDDGYHRMHSYIRDGATSIPTIRMHRTATSGEARDAGWTQARGASPVQRATAALLAAGEDLGELIALARLGGFSALVRTADQANAPWGSENVSKHPPVKPYGATEPLNRDQSPASYGFLAAPDPDNWGGIQDDSAMQMPLSSTASLPPHVAYPDISDWQPEDQDSFGYADRANTAGPSTSITPRDPGGIRMEEARATDDHGHEVELDPIDGWQHLDGSVSHDDGTSVTDGPVTAELHDEPEPALPSTTGDDIEATAAADGTIGGGDAGDGGKDQSPSAVAGLGGFGASAELPGVARQRPGSSGSVREEFRRKFGGTPMGDLARETSPQAQQPSPVGQEPGMGSMDEPLSPDDPSIQTIGNQQWSGGGGDSGEVAVPPGEAQGSIDDIVASFQRSAAARQLSGGTGGTMGDGDIAGAARQYLSKTADALPDAEAAELIAEGRGQRARNLGLLRLEGTHYEEEAEDLSRRGVSLDDYDDDVISV